ncbi:MAG TPA: type II toxin-antitoxin system VapC family toxin, partial [Dehalococcoidia bacterium]|nr:type II toxin-antitoxin system VapC family toxin [Dehalococcoidia bacterium]
MVDASDAVQWYLQDEPYANISARVLDALDAGGVLLAAPDHIRYEIASALYVASKQNLARLTESQVDRALDAFLRVRLDTHNDGELIREAISVARSCTIAFYDGLYVALAQRLGVPLITADRKLYERIRHLPEAL